MKIYSVVVGFESKFGSLEKEETENVLYDDLGEAVDRVMKVLRLENKESYTEGSVLALYERKVPKGRRYAYIVEHKLKKKSKIKKK